MMKMMIIIIIIPTPSAIANRRNPNSLTFIRIILLLVMKNAPISRATFYDGLLMSKAHNYNYVNIIIIMLVHNYNYVNIIIIVLLTSVSRHTFIMFMI